MTDTDYTGPEYVPGARVALIHDPLEGGTVRKCWQPEGKPWHYFVAWDNGKGGVCTGAILQLGTLHDL